jgi:hypothetical protein
VKRALIASALGCAWLAACGWDPSHPFNREAPAVKQAIADLDGGDAASATGHLEEYLSTGACKDGNIGAPELLKRRADGTFDLGLSLFRIGEQFGRRFGEEEIDAGVDEATRARRHAQIECARRVVDAIADDDSVPLELRARARYLQGNLAFLDGDYEGAVRAYDRALVLSPGDVDAGDPVGRDAAWNRAIALRRIEDHKDAGQDASPDAPQDASQDAPHDAGRDGAQDSGQDASKDAGQDSGGGKDAGGGDDDAGRDGGQDAAPPPQSQPPDGGEQEAGAQPPPPATGEDDRMLDQLENAPTLQQEEAKRTGKKRVRGMADK